MIWLQFFIALLTVNVYNNINKHKPRNLCPYNYIIPSGLLSGSAFKGVNHCFLFFKFCLFIFGCVGPCIKAGFFSSWSKWGNWATRGPEPLSFWLSLCTHPKGMSRWFHHQVWNEWGCSAFCIALYMISCCSPWCRKDSDMTGRLNNNDMILSIFLIFSVLCFFVGKFVVLKLAMRWRAAWDYHKMKPLFVIKQLNTLIHVCFKSCLYSTLSCLLFGLYPNYNF